MGIEIERKFLPASDAWKQMASGTAYRQGYLCADRERSVRVRTVADKGFITIKGASVGAARSEYEYQIPHADADALLDELCRKPLIEKLRYSIDHQGFTWEVDEFSGENHGLVVAEIELDSEDQLFAKPDWVGEEVTGDPRYFNSNLVHAPYSKWK